MLPSIADQLVAYRKANALTQAEVADLLGVTQQTVANWEKGATPRQKVLAGVLALLRSTPMKPCKPEPPRCRTSCPEAHQPEGFYPRQCADRPRTRRGHVFWHGQDGLCLAPRGAYLGGCNAHGVCRVLMRYGLQGKMATLAIRHRRGRLFAPLPGRLGAQRCRAVLPLLFRESAVSGYPPGSHHRLRGDLVLLPHKMD